VTGAAGLIGRAVLADLADRGVPATALILDGADDLAAERVVVGDAGDPAVVRSALAGVDAVVHLAAIPAPTLDTAHAVFTRNTGATFTVLEEAGQAGVRRAVIASSFSVTGLPWADVELHPAYLPIDEQLPLQVTDAYALGKQTDEATAEMMARRHGGSIVALRMPFVGQQQQRLAQRAAEFAENPRSGARELWSYLDVRDAARACWLALTRPGPGAHVVFIAADDTLAPFPTEELLDRYHPDVPRRWELPGRASAIDTRAAREMLGFRPVHRWAAEPAPARHSA
jgi:nucleoside-diphosphate-sugar epimerase